ncbi:MAG: hypothetical protein KF752_08525 [Pirellulaceae bacterium]|nr:hypothetical protein [Pirellulaceae bacterium]
MALSIRSFRNTDLRGLSEIWNAHYGQYSQHLFVSAEQFELFVTAKPYFEAGQLLLACLHDRPLGFIHLTCPAWIWQSGEVRKRLDVAAMCVQDHAAADEVAQLLLDAAKSRCVEQRIERSIFRPAVPESAFYLGLGPGDGLAGTLSYETRLNGWLADAGYQPMQPTSVWELTLDEFRAPSDRLQMQVRRGTCVQRQLDEPRLPWWLSCVLGHAEVSSFQLADRATGRTVQELFIWSLASTISGNRPKVAWLWPPPPESWLAQTAGGGFAAADQHLFLLGETFRELNNEKYDRVRVVTSALDNQQHAILRRLGFKAIEEGMVFELPLNPLDA